MNAIFVGFSCGFCTFSRVVFGLPLLDIRKPGMYVAFPPVPDGVGVGRVSDCSPLYVYYVLRGTCAHVSGPQGRTTKGSRSRKASRASTHPVAVPIPLFFFFFSPTIKVAEGSFSKQFVAEVVLRITMIVIGIVKRELGKKTLPHTPRISFRQGEPCCCVCGCDHLYLHFDGRIHTPF